MRVGCQLICVSVIVLSWEECAAVDSSDSPVSGVPRLLASGPGGIFNMY